MNIPDPAVYAALPVVGAFVVWSARSLILQVTGRNEPEPVLINLSARDWLNIMGAIEKQFNGRYLMTEEARQQFGGIRDELQEIRNDIRRVKS
jgi:hypothetical protein